MFGASGLLYGCRNGDRKIVAYQPDGSFESIADDVECNDLVVASDGSIWFTDPANRQVWHISPDRTKRVVAEGFRPNGVILSAGQGSLVVTDSEQSHLWTFRVEVDGSLSHRDRYYMPLQLIPGRDKPGSDGMTVDDRGRLYVATHAGIQMFDPTGRLGGTIAKPQNRFLSNICFGGEGFGFLYATCSDKVYRRKVKPTGTPYFVVSNRK
jgi:sugar lactone lactonase YvrE